MAKRSKWQSVAIEMEIESVEIVEADLHVKHPFVLINGHYHGRIADAQKWAESFGEVKKVLVSSLRRLPKGWVAYEYAILK